MAKEFERITTVITDFYERWYQAYSAYADSYVPTIVMYYWHEGGHYRQHARPTSMIESQKEEVANALTNALKRMFHSQRARVCGIIDKLLDKQGTNEKIGYVRKSLENGCPRYKDILEKIKSNQITPDDCQSLLQLLNSLPFWDFPIKPLAAVFKEEIQGGREDLIFKVKEQQGNLRVKKLHIDQGNISSLSFTLLSSFKPGKEDAYFRLFDLLERSLLIRRKNFIYAYVVPLNDEGFYRGNASLIKFAKGNTDDKTLLRRFIFDIKTQLLPEIRMAMDFEVQSAIRRGSRTLGIGGDRDRARILEKALLFYYPLKVHVAGNKYQIRMIEDDRGRFKKGLAFEADYELSRIKPIGEISKSKQAVADALQWLLKRVEITLKQEQARVKAAYRTALAAVMGRNMSHNIGSHVLFYLSDHTNLDKYHQEYITNRTHNPDIPHPIAVINSYLRERMDLIAEMATASRPAWSISMNLERLIQDFKDQNLLLDNIGRSENVRQDNVYLDVKSASGSQPEDVAVDIPHGVIGVQAFYSILENFIRNSAKHGKVKKELKITITAAANGTSDEEYIKILLNDNLSIEPKKLQTIQKAIKQPLLGKDDTPARQNWGIKEMKICTCFLRMKAPDEVDVKYTPPLLEAGKNEKGNLQYTFYLLKPKEIIIVDGTLPNNMKDKMRLEKVGISLLTNIDALKSKGRLRHRFMVVKLPRNSNKMIWLSHLDQALESLPNRLLVVNDDVAIGGKLEKRAVMLTLEEYQEHVLKLLTDDLPQASLARLYELWILKRFLDSGNEEQLQNQVQLIVAEQEAGNRWDIRGLEWVKGITEVQLAENSGNWKNFLGLGNKKAVIYNRHGREGFQCRVGGIERILEDSQIAYYEAYNQGDPVRLVTYNPPDNVERRKILACSLLEAGLVKILVADERFSLEMKRGENQGKEKELRAIGIHLVKFKNDKEPTLDEIESLLQNDKFHFLCVHQGIFDKIYTHQSTKIDEINQWIDCVQSKHKGLHIIIHSGRGEPHELPKIPNVRYLEYANLARYIRDSRSKFHLVNVLYSLRRETQ